MSGVSIVTLLMFFVSTIILGVTSEEIKSIAHNLSAQGSYRLF